MNKVSDSTGDLANQKVMRQFLLLPIVLGTLLVANGLIGIYAAKTASTQLSGLNDVAMGPTVVFDGIKNNLNLLAKNLLRLNQTGIKLDEQTKIVKKVAGTLKKIAKQVHSQVEASRGLAYEDYLKSWVTSWTAFQTDTELKLQSLKDLNHDLVKKDGEINDLIERMGNVDTFIQADVQDKVDQSNKFSKKTTLTLAMTLILGVFVGIFSTGVIVRSIRSLFRIISEGKKNIETLLNNLDQGFLVFDQTGKIQDGVSKAARIFLGSDPTGRSFHEVLPLDEKGKKATVGWQKLVYEGALSFEDFRPLAPKSFELSDRYVELDFRPIFEPGSESQKVQKVICIASDKTIERDLKEKAENESQLVKLVIKVLADRGSFVDFVLEIRKIMAELKQELKSGSPKVDFLFRGMHSIKGGAAGFHMMKVSHEAHRLESKLAEIRGEKGKNLSEALPSLNAGLLEVENLFDGFLKDHEAIVGRIGDVEDRTKTVPVATINELCQLIFKKIGSESPIFSEFVEKFVQEDLGLSFKRFESVVQEIAARQMKKVNFDFSQIATRVFVDPYLSLVSSFIHVFRNAIDHGIEDEATRLELGKPEAGTIQIAFHKTLDPQGGSSRLKILVKDDGQGIDAEIVRSKAVKKGIVSEDVAKNLSDHEIYQLLFHSGFSTNDQVTDLSGRGVGLDAVKHEAVKLGGTAWIESIKGKGTSFFVEVPLYNSPVLSWGDRIDKK